MEEITGDEKFLKSLYFKDAHFNQEFYEYVERRIAAGKDELSEWSIAFVVNKQGKNQNH